MWQAWKPQYTINVRKVGDMNIHANLRKLRNHSTWWIPGSTNHGNTGWISADRRTEPTLNAYNTRMLLSRLQMIYHIQHLDLQLVVSTDAMMHMANEEEPDEFGPKPILSALLIGCGEQHRLSSMDSDLEAFSHYPTDVSFAALAFQLTAFTNYLIEQFLSY